MKTKKPEFMKPWAKLCAAHPYFDASAATLTVYHERLCRFDVAVIMRAVDAAIDNITRFPTVHELIEIIERLPASDRKLLDEPRPSPEQIAKAQETLQEFIRQAEHRDMKKQTVNVEERKRLLREQALALEISEKAQARKK